MEADWDEITRIAVPPPGPQAPLATASCVLVFDDNQELLWTGNEHGRVTSFYGRELQRYTSVKAHTNEGEVRSLLMHEKGVISLASRSVHLITRRGLTQWHLTHERMLDLRCMSFTSTPTQLLVAGCQSTMFVIDVERGVLLEEIPTTANYTMMKKGRHICAATNDGTIHVISPANLEIVMTWKSAVIIKDMDAQGDFLVTCRSSVRQLGVSVVDPLANVYDLKNLKQMSPIPFPAGAALIRLHPKLQTTSFVASQTGQMQVVDLMNPVSIIMRQANVHTMQGMELSPSGNALAITDHAGYIHLWGSPANIRFNNVNKTIEFADPQPSNIPHVDWNDTPLNTIGMPYYHDKLLSAWPSHLIFDIGAPPPAPLEPAMMPNFQRAEMGYYHTNMNPKGLHRYQIEDTRTTLSAGSIATPKFLSEKARKSPENTFGRRLSDAVNALAGTTLNGKPITDEERMLKYSNVEIKYSRFGVDDFDFKYYNKTPFSGLETHIANSFINSLLQLYKFVPRIRNLALHHTATRCVSEKCLMCEFGFLFDMLERAQGQNCQATNLLRAFGANRDAAALSLFEDAALAGGVRLSSTIQSVNRFFLKHLADDWRSVSVTAEAVDEVLGTSAFEVIRCMYCGGETNRPGAAYVHDLLYPQLDPKHGMHNSLFMFSSILKATIERENKNRGWCNKCRRYQQLVTRKILQQLPVVLMLNTALTNPAMRALWEKPGWLPQKLGILLQNRQVYCLEGKELDREQQRNPSIAVYELVGFVAGVDVNDRHQPHLVSMINVDISKKQPDGLPKHRGFPDWHLFNDFLVQPVDPREALDFSKGWKLPSVLAYQLQSAHGMVDDNWKAALDTSLLYLPHYSINGKPPTSDCIMLTSEEHPKDGVPIALDTEFVDLQKAEIDVKADGTQETIRPARSGLARVSVLRGQGDIEGSPFIDDYITINEPIVDYKTQFSGIRPGDLDTRVSHHNLVPLKVAYKKLWLLLNLGCVFVGHGLASDFRKVNIQVPKSQTVDTQYLYLAPGKNRRFSLKYLAWAVFKEYIQEDSLDLNDPDGHDSIEDARMALRLWRKFQEYEDAGITEQMIEDIYRKGSKYGWKPPARDGTIAASNSGLPSGRNTPDLNGASTPTPVTPAKGLLRLSASNVPAFAPGMAIIRESPLR